LDGVTRIAKKRRKEETDKDAGKAPSSKDVRMKEMKVTQQNKMMGEKFKQLNDRGEREKGGLVSRVCALSWVYDAKKRQKRGKKSGMRALRTEMVSHQVEKEWSAFFLGGVCEETT
jgi:hypothetical protein